MNKYESQIEGFEKYMTKYKSDNTRDQYIRNFNIFLEWLGDRDITTELIEEFLMSLAGGFSTKNGYKSGISLFCKFMKMKPNPTHGIELKRDVVVKEVKMATTDQYERIMNLIEDEKTELMRLRYKVIFTLIRENGMRIGEVIKLEVSDIGDESLLLRATKNRTTRRIPIDKWVEDLIREYIAEAEVECKLFDIVADTVRKRMQSYCEKLNIPYGEGVGITPHSFRHSRAHELVIDENMPERLVADYLGNTPKTLERYLHPTFNDMKQLRRGGK